MEIIIIGLVLYLLTKKSNGSEKVVNGIRYMKDPITGLWKKVERQ